MNYEKMDLHEEGRSDQNHQRENEKTERQGHSTSILVVHRIGIRIGKHRSSLILTVGIHIGIVIDPWIIISICIL